MNQIPETQTQDHKEITSDPTPSSQTLLDHENRYTNEDGQVGALIGKYNFWSLNLGSPYAEIAIFHPDLIKAKINNVGDDEVFKLLVELFNKETAEWLEDDWHNCEVVWIDPGREFYLTWPEDFSLCNGETIVFKDEQEWFKP